jgi:hypothetical protein
MAEIIAHHTGQPFEQVERDIDRDRFMDPEDAKTYGIIDEVISSRSLDGGALMPGEPGRIAREQHEAAPAENPDA